MTLQVVRQAHSSSPQEGRRVTLAAQRLASQKRGLAGTPPPVSLLAFANEPNREMEAGLKLSHFCRVPHFLRPLREVGFFAGHPPNRSASTLPNSSHQAQSSIRASAKIHRPL